MAEAMSEEAASSWYDDAPITDEQYASVWDSAMAVQERPSYSRHVVRKLLAKVDRLRTEAAYMREQIEQQAQVIKERKTQTVAYRALAEEHQRRGDKLSAQLAEIGETREEWGVRVDGCTDTIGVYPGRESAEENLALWRKVWPSSEFTLMQRENRAAVVSGWREVPDA